MNKNKCKCFNKETGTCEDFECKTPCDYAAVTGSCKESCESYFNCECCEYAPENKPDETEEAKMKAAYPIGTMLRYKGGNEYIVYSVDYAVGNEWMKEGWYVVLYNAKLGPLYNKYPIPIKSIEKDFEKVGELID